MLVCEGSVVTAWEWANVNRAPWLTRRSRFGVCAAPSRGERVGAKGVDRHEQDVLIRVRFDHERRRLAQHHAPRR
jgi:hypothetical protein